MYILDKKVSNHNRQISVFNTAAKPCSDDEESDGLYKEDENSKHSDLTRQGKYKHSKKA